MRLILRVAIVSTTSLIISCRSSAPATTGSPAAQQVDSTTADPAQAKQYSPEQVARGRLLVLGGSCNDCHTPWTFDEKLQMPAPDWSRMLSGHPEGAPGPSGELGAGDIALFGPTFTSFGLPFGITYAMNLTPDMDTGTGSWTEKMFLTFADSHGNPIDKNLKRIWSWVERVDARPAMTRL